MSALAAYFGVDSGDLGDRWFGLANLAGHVGLPFGLQAQIVGCLMGLFDRSPDDRRSRRCCREATAGSWAGRVKGPLLINV